MNRKPHFCAITLSLAACSAEHGQAPSDGAGNRSDPVTEARADNGHGLGAKPAAGPAKPPPPPLLGEVVTLAEWREADNRADCAPIALASDGGDPNAKPRRATFSGGWAVAFDTPEMRSAFGIAGTGLLPEDEADFAAKAAALAVQWPYVHRWGATENLPAGSVAGYGVSGAEPYPRTNQAGHRLHSLAYLRIPGQKCQYNVWSRISRVHLETILRLATIVSPGVRPR